MPQVQRKTQTGGEIVKVSELSGAGLDLWVGKAEGMVPGIDGYMRPCLFKGRSPVYNYSPSTDWSQGGPIIERELIEIAPHFKAAGYETSTGEWYWQACVLGENDMDYESQYGPTPLIAGMRCFVASKFGEEVADE
jgi:hypothetical protein